VDQAGQNGPTRPVAQGVELRILVSIH
jgi:hypothetical protein